VVNNSWLVPIDLRLSNSLHNALRHRTLSVFSLRARLFFYF
jgi:hypothetical protein